MTATDIAELQQTATDEHFARVWLDTIHAVAGCASDDPSAVTLRFGHGRWHLSERCLPPFDDGYGDGYCVRVKLAA